MEENMDPSVDSFLNADELDDLGITADTLGRGKNKEHTTLGQPAHLDVVDDGRAASVNVNVNIEEQRAPQLPQRPPLRRDPSAPHQQPPIRRGPTHDPRDANEPNLTTDSLSLGQLRRIVDQMPGRFEPTPYAFIYKDYSTFPEELDELFTYAPSERASLMRAKNTFVSLWTFFLKGEHVEHVSQDSIDDIEWTKSTLSDRTAFLHECKADLDKSNPALRLQALESILHIALGVWHETAGKPDKDYMAQLERDVLAAQGNEAQSKESAAELRKRYRRSGAQLSAIRTNVEMIAETVSTQAIYDCFRNAYLLASNADVDPAGPSENGSIIISPRVYSRQLWVCSILLYLIVDLSVRSRGSPVSSVLARSCVTTLQPDLLTFLTEVLADMRWDDSETTPALKIFLLYWKTILASFGGLEDVDLIKNQWNAQESGDRDCVGTQDDALQPKITASPLDYHIFRQEITSKYPAFDPPVPLFPFDPETTSMVPPLRDQENKSPSLDSGIGPAAINNNSASIIHQPVHIATPAPSPPPIPAGPGGKGIKKQNYQTNQMFPFLYPPLGVDSNAIGGKGSTEIQDVLVGRRWSGSDVPTSILEAAELFAHRMRATRAMRQLWKERVRFMKYERGYDMNDLSIEDEVEVEQQERSDLQAQKEQDHTTLNRDSRERLEAVEEFYEANLPQLQSVVIVWMKVILQTVTALITQPNAPNGLQNGWNSASDPVAPATEESSDRDGAEVDETDDPLLRDLDTMRSQEILSKAVTGTITLLLKWLKLSHILKFEYLTQLILDSNYVQLLLKLFTHQEPERVVNYRCERNQLNFLKFCAGHSRSGRDPSGATFSDSASDSSVSSFSAAPPPIVRTSRPSNTLPDAEIPDLPPPPEVDELGYLTSEIPASPITTYSWRNFFTLINHVRILQKIAKGKPHRQLLMVQYKYASVLRKNLKVPQSAVRLYTLKCIKGQVPYSHRKWRQGNMRIITAIYLHCRPELRDEWLAGIDVDQEMVDALPQERALRSLTYWYNLKRYPDAMGRGGAVQAVMGLEEQEQDFFVRELEKMDFVVRQRGGGLDLDQVDEELAAREELAAQRLSQTDGFIM